LFTHWGCKKKKRKKPHAVYLAGRKETVLGMRLKPGGHRKKKKEAVPLCLLRTRARKKKGESAKLELPKRGRPIPGSSNAKPVGKKEKEGGRCPVSGKKGGPGAILTQKEIVTLPPQNLRKGEDHPVSVSTPREKEEGPLDHVIAAGGKATVRRYASQDRQPNLEKGGGGVSKKEKRGAWRHRTTPRDVESRQEGPLSLDRAPAQKGGGGTLTIPSPPEGDCHQSHHRRHGREEGRKEGGGPLSTGEEKKEEADFTANKGPTLHAVREEKFLTGKKE